MKRYLHEKIRYVQGAADEHEHVLIVPGRKSGSVIDERSRTYTIASPLVSRKTQYRMLLNLRAVDEILARERPDLIESADPYQLGWRAAAASQLLRTPAIAFYHSHFPEAYLEPRAARAGKRVAAAVHATSRGYVRKLYNRFDATLVASATLAETLRDWGVRNVRVVDLGVDTEIFRPAEDAKATRESLGIAPERKLLLYVGRLAVEKNVRVLFDAFQLLHERNPGEFHLLVIGDGIQRRRLQDLVATTGAVTWLPYCAEPAELARYYRAADLFVHFGMRETFGLVAVESQACGTPVVGIAGSRMDDVIVGDQSWWARENTVTTLADSIAAGARQNLKALGLHAAAEVAQRFAWPRVFDRLFCIYREVCAEYRRDRP